MKPVDVKEIFPNGGDSRAMTVLQECYVIFKKEDFEKAPTVYGMKGHGFGQYRSISDTHKAKLICVEEIKKCEHENVSQGVEFGGSRSHRGLFFRCEDCHKELKPKSGWELA